nr:MAG TPA: hypothetical protein [Bacteriophage sp.]
MCGLPFARPLSSFVRYTAHSHTDRALPGHLAQNRGREPHRLLRQLVFKTAPAPRGFILHKNDRL